jgi:hypothetical protein
LCIYVGTSRCDLLGERVIQIRNLKRSKDSTTTELQYRYILTGRNPQGAMIAQGWSKWLRVPEVEAWNIPESELRGE